MPTPGSGAISMNDMNTEILRASGTATVSMSEIRTRYGGSGAISFSDLRNAEGFTVNPANYSSKFANIDGWDLRVWGFGSISPNEATGIQVAANCYIGSMTSSQGAYDDCVINMYSNTGLNQANGSFTAGFTSSNITRFVAANTARTLGITSGDGSLFVTYDWPTTGTIHCLIKF